MRRFWWFLITASFAIWGAPALAVSLLDVPFGAQLECLQDHANDLAAGKSMSIANSNRTACHSNWRYWYKGNVSYITNECPGCTDRFFVKLVELTSACLDSDDAFTAQLKEREGMTLSKSASHEICVQRRQLEEQIVSHKKNVAPPVYKAPKGNLI